MLIWRKVTIMQGHLVSLFRVHRLYTFNVIDTLAVIKYFGVFKCACGGDKICLHFWETQTILVNLTVLDIKKWEVPKCIDVHIGSNITPLLAELHWLPVRRRIHYKILLITFKVLHGLSPKYLSDLISIQQPSSYNLKRNDNGRLLERPSAKTKKTMGDRAFQVAAPLLWNKLPRCVRNTTNLESFKTLIKTFLFKESFQLSIYSCNYRLLI